MKRVEFAKLAGISPAMVTKYDEQGFVVFSSPKVVDARATLDRLAGRLDEDKRRAALEKLTPGENAGEPRRPPVRSAKIEIDELKRDTLALELARRAGELIPVADVEATILDAIAGMQAAFDLETRATADQLTIDLGLSPERTAMLARRLRTLCNHARQRFAGEMLKLAGGDSVAARATPAAAADKAPSPG